MKVIVFILIMNDFGITGKLFARKKRMRGIKRTVHNRIYMTIGGVKPSKRE